MATSDWTGADDLRTGIATAGSFMIFALKENGVPSVVEMNLPTLRARFGRWNHLPQFRLKSGA
jgi:hypothetical protein